MTTYNSVAVSESDKKRFWAKVNKTQECWLWTANKRAGYGLIRVGSVMASAHRLSYAIQHGSITERDVICHTCDNPGCVNPSHLYLGTNTTNARDKSERNRTQSVFTNEQIVEARVRAARGENLYDICKVIGTDKHQSLLQAIRGNTFRHLKTAPVKNVDISKDRKVNKLTKEQVEEIKEALKKPFWGQGNLLARKYGVTHATISLIKAGRYK